VKTLLGYLFLHNPALFITFESCSAKPSYSANHTPRHGQHNQ
jgi:hypothetical protein